MDDKTYVREAIAQRGVLSPREVDPMRFAATLWPDTRFYPKQEEVIYSVWENDETFVPAGNELGKDFVSGFIVPAFFLTRTPCKIITTSVKEDHLRVLWGEIGQFIRSAAQPLDYKQGGPLMLSHFDLRKIVNREKCPLSYVRGMVAAEGAAMQGHHANRRDGIDDGIPRTLFVVDEASGVDDTYWGMAKGWAKRCLVIGNPWTCNNFFYKGVKGDPQTNDRGGDLPRPEDDDRKGYYRKVIRIRAQDSPNVVLAEAQQRAGVKPTGKYTDAQGNLRHVIAGVRTWEKYREARQRLDKYKQCVQLDGEFYEGAELKLFPQEWLEASHKLADQWGIYTPLTYNLPPGKKVRRKGKAIGVDCAQGGDDTSWAVVDEHGVIELMVRSTPDTNVIPGLTIAFARKHNVPWDRVMFDLGNGGKEHVDRIRAKGYNVRGVFFGSAASEDPEDRDDRQRRKNKSEARIVYKNRRAEMYGNLRELLDPSIMSLEPFERAEAFKAIQGHGQAASTEFHGFAIPRVMEELTRQMKPIPLSYDQEGRMYIWPKHPKDADDSENLTRLIGCSPDELDSVVLAVHGMLRPEKQAEVIVA